MEALPDRGYEWPSNHHPLYPIDPRTVSFVDHEVLEEASHELKTPLSSIRNSLTLLKLGASGPIPQDALDVLDVVERNTTRMMALIEEILFAQRATLVFEPVGVDALVNSAIEMISGELGSKKIELQYVRSNLIVSGDEKKLVQVLVNLLSNAIKFSPNNGVIKVHAQVLSNRSVTISVSDQGAGVPESDFGRIFLKHQQGEAQRDKGSGLGLAISKRIVEMHGGQIGVHNGSTCGASFWIRLKQAAKSADFSPGNSRSDGKVA